MLKNIGCSDVALASSLHEFKSPALAEAYQDSDLTPVGVAYLEDIAGLKDILNAEKLSGFKCIKRMALNKSGHYYLRKLSRSERKAFIKGFISGNRFMPLKTWLDSNFQDTEDMLGMSFTWAESKEGHEYWSIVGSRLRWVTNLLNG